MGKNSEREDTSTAASSETKIDLTSKPGSAHCSKKSKDINSGPMQQKLGVYLRPRGEGIAGLA